MPYRSTSLTDLYPGPLEPDTDLFGEPLEPATLEPAHEQLGLLEIAPTSTFGAPDRAPTAGQASLL